MTEITPARVTLAGKTPPATTDRVLALIEAYGGDPTRWPEHEREPAVARMSGDPTLARAAEQARRLDLVLDVLPDPVPSPALRVTLKEIPDRGSGLMDLLAGWFGVWRPAAGLVAATVLGIAIGVANPDLPVPGFGSSNAVAAEATTDTDSYSIAAATAFGVADTQDIY